MNVNYRVQLSFLIRCYLGVTVAGIFRALVIAPRHALVSERDSGLVLKAPENYNPEVEEEEDYLIAIQTPGHSLVVGSLARCGES